MGAHQANVEIPRGGVRLTWAELPDHVRTAIEGRLGSSVVTADSQTGGFSPGVAARVQLADGSRAFVKAASPALNEHTPAMYRREAEVAAALPAGLPVSRLRGTIDDGEWIVLIFDDVDGRMPALPWQQPELERVLGALTVLAGRLTPSPLPAPAVAEYLAEDFGAWRRLAAGGPDATAIAGPGGVRLPDWAARHLAGLADLESQWTDKAAGETLLHIDLRADNLLLTDDGGVVVVDWAQPAVGARWIGTVCFAINPALFGGHDPEQLVVEHPVAGKADPAAVDALLCGVLGYFVWMSRQPAPYGLPTVRRFQRAQEQVVLDWLGRRLGWA